MSNLHRNVLKINLCHDHVCHVMLFHGPQDLYGNHDCEVHSQILDPLAYRSTNYWCIILLN